MRQPLENQRRQGPVARPGGFTLVELLITITIVGILAGVVLAAVQSARETAKIAKTKATITKLHYIIMRRYDSYRTRRVPIDVKQYVFNHSGTGDYYDGWDDSQAYAHARLMALRDLMRMEMPDRWSDVVSDPSHPDTAVTTDTPFIKVLPTDDAPSLSKRYFRAYRAAWLNMQDRAAAGAMTSVDADKIVQEYGPAECLYMIVMSIPEAAEQFQNTEIGDVDGDGLKEFIDGWEHPINFIRWPVGFVDYANLSALTSTGSGPTGPAGQEGEDPVDWGAPSDLQSGDRIKEPDAFDPMGVGGGFTVYLLNPPIGAGYNIFPLIYSAGPDGIFDININRPSNIVSGYSNPLWPLDPYMPLERAVADSAGNTLVYLGQPIDGDAIDGTPKNDEPDHYDNITNHMLEVR